MWSRPVSISPDPDLRMPGSPCQDILPLPGVDGVSPWHDSVIPWDSALWIGPLPLRQQSWDMKPSAQSL